MQNRPTTRHLFAATILTLLGFAWNPVAAQTDDSVAQRAYALGNNSITIIDEAGFKSLGSIALPKPGTTSGGTTLKRTDWR